MELKWCCKKPSMFPSHIHTMFAAVRSHLEACDVKWVNRVWTATRYKLRDFKGIMEEEDEKRQREEREEVEKEREGERGEQKEFAKEGDKEWTGNVNDVAMTSWSTEHLQSTATNEQLSPTPTTSPNPMPMRLDAPSTHLNHSSCLSSQHSGVILWPWHWNKSRKIHDASCMNGQRTTVSHSQGRCWVCWRTWKWKSELGMTRRHEKPNHSPWQIHQWRPLLKDLIPC